MESFSKTFEAGRFMNIDGSTTIVGVFGSPITHTASPAMHNAAFKALKMNWVYLAFPVEPQNLRAALLGARDMGLMGINLTVPHKLLALDIMDEVGEEARKFGTANVDYIYEQPSEELFAGLIPQYVSSMLYHAMTESVAAEHAARMTAMDSATNNASDMIDALTLHMNRVRQAAITKEIIEIVSGAAAQ